MQILVFECKFPGGMANIRQDPLLSERCIEAINPDRPAMERSSNKTGGWGWEMMFLQPYEVYFKKRPSGKGNRNISSYAGETENSIKTGLPNHQKDMQFS